jgi:hypothetical protein
MDINSEFIQNKIKELNSNLMITFDQIDKIEINPTLEQAREYFFFKAKLIDEIYTIIESLINRSLTFEEKRTYF